MSPKPEKSNEQLDRLLRRWGAEEAVRQVRTDHLPPPVPRARRSGERPSGARPSAVWQWLPLAASLVLIAGATTMLLVVRNAPREADRSEAASLRQELGNVRIQLEEATETLKRERAARDALTRDMAALRRDWVTARSELLLKKATLGEQATKLAAAAQEARTLNDRLSANAESLKKASQELDARRKQLADAHQARVAEARELRALIARQKKALAAAQSAAKNAGAGLAALRAKRQRTRAAFRRIYLAAAAPGQTGLRARQTAARANRLLPRCGELRDSLRSEPTRKLADRLEVALTRLELLDANRPQDVAAFASQLKKPDLARRVEEIVAAGREAPAMCRWLLEAELILTEMNGEDF